MKSNAEPEISPDTDQEVLDEIIKIAFKSLKKKIDHISPEVAMKAIRLKHEITEGRHNGLTEYGLEKLRLREEAKLHALQQVIREYIPREKWDEVLTRMERVQREFYESLGLGEEYRRIKQMEEDEE